MQAFAVAVGVDEAVAQPSLGRPGSRVVLDGEDGSYSL
jgi:hypothetical protein